MIQPVLSYRNDCDHGLELVLRGGMIKPKAQHTAAAPRTSSRARHWRSFHQTWTQKEVLSWAEPIVAALEKALTNLGSRRCTEE